MITIFIFSVIFVVLSIGTICYSSGKLTAQKSNHLELMRLRSDLEFMHRKYTVLYTKVHGTAFSPPYNTAQQNGVSNLNSYQAANRFYPYLGT